MDSRTLIKKLIADGFEVSVKGSHHKFPNSKTGRTVVVPHPKQDVPIGTVYSICRQAGWRK